VLVRETARLIVAAWLGLRLRAILLLPIGGLYAYADPESQENANQGAGQFAIALAGPLANAATALLLAMAFLGAGGDIHLFSQPIITSAYLLRSMVWMQAGLGLVHLLPAYPLDFGRLIRGSFARKYGLAPTGRAAAGLGQVLALTAMVAGMLLHNPWLIIAGFFVMIGAQVEDQGVFFQSVVDTVRMREVMLTDFATLSPSDTLADALVRCVHSLQETFLSSAAQNWSASFPANAFWTPCATMATAMCRRSCRVPFRWRALKTRWEPPSAVSPPGTVWRSFHHRQRARGRHRERAKPDEFHVLAGRAAAHRTAGSRRLTATMADNPQAPLAPGLYLVATPIGNLGDITLRALDILRRVDRIACEDTRQTQKLLNHYQIATPTVSCHQHNERQRTTELLDALKAAGASLSSPTPECPASATLEHG